MVTALDIISAFHHDGARRYAHQLYHRFGSPHIFGPGLVMWSNEAQPGFFSEPYTRVQVVDESIKHDFPAEHHDFVYTTAQLDLTGCQACKLVKVSGSIIIDLLKGEVTARCGGLTANDVTLNFVEDVKNGRVEASKSEYAYRIKNKIVPDSYQWYLHDLV